MQEISKSKMLLTCLLGIIATIGVARFAYTPMIPEMVKGAGLTDDLAGYLATANYAGYLCGALLISFISSIALKARLFKAGLILAVITSAGMGASTSEWMWYLMRFFSGLSSASGMLLGAGLLMHWYIKRNHSAVLGGFFTGLGIGIVITAVIAKIVAPYLSWELQWHVYALVTLVLILPVFKWLPDFSKEKALSANKASGKHFSRAFIPMLQIAYFCAGIGYVVSATFLMAIAEGTNELQGHGWLIWLVTGIACAPASALWDRIILMTDQWSALLMAFMMKALSLVLLIYSQNLLAVLLSALLYGASFIGIVSMMLAMVGRLFPENPSKPMSKLTFSYGVAQMVGPAVVGYMANLYGDFEQGLLFTLIAVMLGAVFLYVARGIAMSHQAPRQPGQINHCR